MIITRERKHVVNMGNYESLTIGATVEVDTEVHESTITPQELDELLDKMLADEVNEAKELTNTKDSYILSYRSGK